MIQIVSYRWILKKTPDWTASWIDNNLTIELCEIFLRLIYFKADAKWFLIEEELLPKWKLMKWKVFIHNRMEKWGSKWYARFVNQLMECVLVKCFTSLRKTLKFLSTTCRLYEGGFFPELIGTSSFCWKKFCSFGFWCSISEQTICQVFFFHQQKCHICLVLL